MTDGRRRGRTDGVTLRQRLRYRFDILLARGTGATLVWLGILTLVVVAISAIALALFGVALSGSQGDSYFESFWQSLMRTLDPGTMADDVGWGRRILALLVTIFGLLVSGRLPSAWPSASALSQRASRAVWNGCDGDAVS